MTNEAKLRKLCLSLPEATEVEAWGHPTFRVKNKIFATCGGDTMSVKTTKDHQQILIQADARFTIAHYVGKHGWVTFAFEGKINWKQMESLVRASYVMVAPKKLAEQVKAK